MIRLMHIISGLLIIALLWWAQDRSVIDVPFMGVQSPETEKKIEYALMLLSAFFIGRGLITACVVKQKLLRWKQGLHGFALIIVGGPIMDGVVLIPKHVINTAADDKGFQIEAPVEQITLWHPGIFLIFLGIFWILVGLTGKGVTSKCIHFGEIVKKIRV